MPVATVDAAVTLPVEVVGEDGTTASVIVDVPASRAREVKLLWMQIHNLSYPDMVSVRVNGGAWLSLNNRTVSVTEPAGGFGGIGGGFSTLRVTLALPADAIVGGANSIRFRFNKTDGLASGFRVVAFNLLTADSTRVLGAEAFTQDDPDAWAPPLAAADAVLAGGRLWRSAQLRSSPLPNAPQIRAHCSDCHAHDGRDLKYFAFSNASIIARSRFHGLSEREGKQIASYIRSSSPGPSPGRPWNPPYQPGPGVRARPVASWAAGAGLSWVLDSDTATLSFVLAQSGYLTARSPEDVLRTLPDWRAIAPAIVRSAFRPDGNLDPREIPIALQLPDWNHWLPRVHPLDAWGSAFEKSEFAELYGSMDGSPADHQAPGSRKLSLREILSSPQGSALVAAGRVAAAFDRWRESRRGLLKRYVERGDTSWSPELMNKAYSTQLWQLVKTWEMTQEFRLEERGREMFGPAGEVRTWPNTIPAATAPAAANIPDGPSGMGGSALTNEYFNTSWYELQVIVNSGHHRHRGRLPVDWLYLVAAFQDLYRESRTPEPGRLLVTLIKSIQSTDPGTGPEDFAQGWRPEQNVDPSIMISDVWAPIFQSLGIDARRVLSEAFLAAWLEKNRQYSFGQYFHVGLSATSYALPPSLGGIAGGRVWDAAPLFAAAGVDRAILTDLQRWGAGYMNAASRFQYSPSTSVRRKGTATPKTGESTEPR